MMISSIPTPLVSLDEIAICVVLSRKQRHAPALLEAKPPPSYILPLASFKSYHTHWKCLPAFIVIGYTLLFMFL
jgi:hypothetical protein